ncbi:MAG: hypothetical protein QGG00_09665 [Verrucomicrobiota bacterium]|jgi:hypothetical protein|nr:hypothetical protein [Verrucomicrobiota bacterium]
MSGTFDSSSLQPMAVRMLTRICDGDTQCEEEALDTVRSVLQASTDFLDGVHHTTAEG